MRNIEKRISGLIIGSIFPLLLGLLSITIWFLLDRAESRPLLYLAIGLILGLLINLKYLNVWINRRFDLPNWITISIYIIYNIFVYGFFMGFPVFNVFLGILAGYYFANRICYKKVKIDEYPKLINQVTLITGLIMLLVCISSGFLALMDYGAAGMIKDLLGLDFEVSNSMMWGIVIIGGLVLILINILLTRFTIRKTIKNYIS